MIIRKAELRDVPAIFEMINHYAAEKIMLPRPLTDLYESVREFLVAEDEEGQVLGCGALKFYNAELAEVRSLCVAPGTQHRGMGRALVERVLAEAESYGLKTVFALTLAPEFFLKCGFRQPILAERIPDLVEPWPIEIQILGNAVIDAAKDFGDFDIDLGSLTQFPQVGLIFGARPLPGGRIKLWQMINDHPQVGNQVGEPDDGCQQLHVGIGRVQFQVSFGKSFQAGNEFRFREFLAQVPAPQVSVANAAKQWITVKAFQLLVEIRLPRFQVSDGSDDDGIFGRNVQYPLIILQPRAALHLNRAHHSQTFRELAIALRQRRPVKDRVILGRPGNTLWAPRIEQMNMGVDNGYG